ncbi:MAG: hypothetical protein WKF48_05275 [Solirubrobacteraceae bacterium]
MATIVAVAEQAVNRGPPTYRLIADDEHHRPFLPEGFSGYETRRSRAASARGCCTAR